MADEKSERPEVGLTSESQGQINRDDRGDKDDIIYVDLTKDPESQNWLGTPAKERQSFCERSEKDKEDLKSRFQNKLEELDR